MELSPNSYDFAGWATRANHLCTDGRTILPDAFKHHDGEIVPLIWNHQHNDPFAVLGKALLHCIDGDVYAYCSFNDTESGNTAKELVKHGDVCSLSICANQLKHNSNRGVMHGMIRELSLVVAGANPEARIDAVRLAHSADGDEFDDEIHIYPGKTVELFHADNGDKENKEDAEVAEEIEKIDEVDKTEDGKKEKTIKEILETLTEEQTTAVCYVIGEALKEKNESKETDNEEDTEMKHNVFENEVNQDDTLMHADIITNAIADAKRFGRLSDSVIEHAAANNITDIAELFPMEKDLNIPPEWVKEDESWVAKIMGSVHHTPFSRVRALFAQMDEAEARARGYIKGEMKKSLALAVLKRTTQPTTVYIKMTMDRDDKVDISFDALPWIRAEARKQLDRELARAYLLGDNRDLSSHDKIDELCIRPVLTDDDMYTIKYTVTDGTDHHNDFNSASENDSEAKGIIRAAIKARKQYKGSGKPTFYTTEDLLTELLLIEDQNGRRIYESEAALATAMRVKEIVTIPEMEQHDDIYGIIVNMNDYNVGADKGGAVAMFEDFDIDYNQEKILMETRCSGALVKPYSAIVLKKNAAG